MVSIDLASVERRARRGYELSRLGLALVGFAPALAVVAVATGLGHRPESALLFGAGLFALGALSLWYGRGLRRAVLPGTLAGVVPLAMALLAAHCGHFCAGDRCLSFCIPACVAGGVASGLALGTWLVRSQAGRGSWLAASGLALLTGAMGCACVGFSGVIGMAAGYALGLMPRLVSART